MPIMFPTGRCSLGEACRCPDGELRPKYKCAKCGRQLHNVVQGCAATFDDEEADEDQVQCINGMGCHASSEVPGKEEGDAYDQNMKEMEEDNIGVKEEAEDDGEEDKEGEEGDEGDDDEEMKDADEDKDGDDNNENDADTSANQTPRRGRKRSSTGSETAVTKRRPVLPGSKKRGIPKGAKIASNKKLDDWYYACKKFEDINKTRKMSQAMFLRSEESGPLFTGKVSEQQSFGRYLNKYKSGELKPTSKKR